MKNSKLLVSVFVILALFAFPLGMWAQSTIPPTLESLNIEVKCKSGARSLNRDKGYEMVPVGKRDFILSGMFESNLKDHSVKVGNALLKGYDKDVYKIPSSLVPAFNESGYVSRMNERGEVSWSLVLKEGELEGMRIATQGEDAYLLMILAPTHKTEVRPAEDNVVAIWEGVDGQRITLEDPTMPKAADNSKFDQRRYLYLMKVNGQGHMSQPVQPIRVKAYDNPAGLDIDWIELVAFAVAGDKQDMVIRVKNATLELGYAGPTIDHKARTSGSNQQLLLASFQAGTCTKVSYIETSDNAALAEEKYTEAFFHGGACYISQYVKAAAGQTFSWGGDALTTGPGAKGWFLMRVDGQTHKKVWHHVLPSGMDIEAIAAANGLLYLGGGIDKDVSWGTETIAFDEGTSEYSVDNTPYWATLKLKDGAYGIARSIKGANGHVTGISADAGRVYTYVKYIDDSKHFFGETRSPFLDFGGEYTKVPIWKNEDEVNEANMGQFGLVIYNMVGDFVTHSSLQFSVDYMNLRVRGAVLSNDQGVLGFFTQSGQGGSLSGIHVLADPFPTPKSELYGGFVTLFQLLQLKSPRYDLALEVTPASVAANVVLKKYPGGEALTPGIGVFSAEDKFTIETPKQEGYEDNINVQIEGAELKDVGGATFYQVVGDVTIGVTYALKSYSLAINSSLDGQGGAVVMRNEQSIASGSAAVQHGDLLTITATEVEGYTCALQVEGATLEGSTYKVTGNVTVTVTYTLKTYSLAVTSSLEGQGGATVKLGENVIMPGAGVVAHDQQVSIVPIAVDGYQLILEVTGAVRVAEGSPLYRVTGDVKVHVRYVQDLYNLAVQSSLSGQGGAMVKRGEYVVVPGNGVVASGDLLTITAVDVDGYTAEVKVEGATLEGATYKVTGNVSVTVTYTLKSYSLAIASSLEGQGGATVKRGDDPVTAGDAVVKHGDMLTIASVDVEGYTAEMKVEGATSEGSAYKVTGNVTVTVTYTLKTYSLAIASSLEGQGGATVKRGDDPVTVGEAAVKHGDMLTIAPADVEGYMADVKVEGAVQEGTSYKVMGNVTVTVIYTLKSYSLAIVSSLEGQGGATVKRGEEAIAAGDAAVKHGDLLSVEAMAIADYTAEVKVEGAVLEGTLYKVTGNVIVTVTYTRITFTVVQLSHRGYGSLRLLRGTIEVKEGAKVNSGELLQLETLPVEGYVVRSGSLRIEGLAIQGSVYKVTGNVKVSIDFDPEPKRTPVIDGTLDRPTLQVNPVVSMLVVQKAAQVAHYALYDAEGHAVLTGQHDGAEELAMDAASLRSGLYLLSLRMIDGQTFTLRMVKR